MALALLRALGLPHPSGVVRILDAVLASRQPIGAYRANQALNIDTYKLYRYFRLLVQWGLLTPIRPPSFMPKDPTLYGKRSLWKHRRRLADGTAWRDYHLNATLYAFSHRGMLARFSELDCERAEIITLISRRHTDSITRLSW